MNDDIERRLAHRSPEVYADFVLELLEPAHELLDMGCGDGMLSIGLAQRCRVTAVDLSAEVFSEAVEIARRRNVDSIRFEVADATALPFADETFDVVFAHSVLEAGPAPQRVLAEALRVLRPGGLLGVACVEYGGLILAGPEVSVLRWSNAVREQLWLAGGSNPFLGRELRGLVATTGFVDVRATTRAISYGTAQQVRVFADARAAECADEEYVGAAVAAGLAVPGELAAAAQAWEQWAESPASYASFTWCRAVGRKPSTDVDA